MNVPAARCALRRLRRGNTQNGTFSESRRASGPRLWATSVCERPFEKGRMTGISPCARHWWATPWRRIQPLRGHPIDRGRTVWGTCSGTSPGTRPGRFQPAPRSTRVLGPRSTTSCSGTRVGGAFTRDRPHGERRNRTRGPTGTASDARGWPNLNAARGTTHLAEAVGLDRRLEEHRNASPRKASAENPACQRAPERLTSYRHAAPACPQGGSSSRVRPTHTSAVLCTASAVKL